MPDDKQDEPVKTFRPWVGVVLSFFIAGSSQFLAGEKLVGISWFTSILLLKSSGMFCLDLASGDAPGFMLFAVALALWVVMLVKSCRPVPRFRWIGWICFVVISLLLSETITSGMKVFIHPFSMPTSSMTPTIQGNTKQTHGDHFFVQKYAYWFGKPQRGDVVVFETKGIPEDQRELYRIPPDEFYIKRVVGIPGDVLSIQSGHFYNHGEILSQPSILAKFEFRDRPWPMETYLANSTNNYTVPAGSYFVIGDNTANSLDSRFWGTIPEKSIIGRVSKIYWPLNRAGKIQ